jgi:erythromycin esterase-like protein
MTLITQQKLLDAFNKQANPILTMEFDYAKLQQNIKGARIVLMGEATHGTHEFYAHRAEITKQLILQQGFDAVAIEGDWPFAYTVNTWVKRVEPGPLEQALAGFKRFPSWMWRNTVMQDFLSWLQAFNQQKSGFLSDQVGFYGLDLYSLHASIQAIIDGLSPLDPPSADRARSNYACFEWGEEPQAYGYAVAHGLITPCAHLVNEQFLALQQTYEQALEKDSWDRQERYFCLMQNALLVKDAELYYRTLFQGPVSSWNVRDQHMLDSLVAIDQYITHQKRRPARIVVWAHNSHIGDARATEMSQQGEHNLGQLVRQAYGKQCAIIGLTTYQGSVTAASQWGQAPLYKIVNPALPASYEFIMHLLQTPDFWVSFSSDSLVAQYLNALEPRLQRAIGVVYRPDTERSSHYFYTQLAKQFDLLIHFDTSQALKPMD